MAWTKAKAAIAVTLGVLLTAGTATVAVTAFVGHSTPVIRIKGHGQVELVGFRGQSRVVETADLVIETDGNLYHISIDSQGDNDMTNDVYDVRAEYGYDGTDIFVLSDRLSPLHRTRAGFGGFAYPGRYPFMDEFPPSPVHAVWLAYCSRDFFNLATNRSSFQMAAGHPMIPPLFVTNLPAAYWPDSTLPQSITGWSRNWYFPPRANSEEPYQAVELKQYPGGYKAWQFTASDPVQVGDLRLPKQATLETFFPKPPASATTGEDTLLIRKATFTADSIEIVRGRWSPFPNVPVRDLEVMDSRFEDVAGPFVITSHATPKGWPVRGSAAFNQTLAAVKKLAQQNRTFIAAERAKAPQVIPP